VTVAIPATMAQMARRALLVSMGAPEAMDAMLRMAALEQRELLARAVPLAPTPPTVSRVFVDRTDRRVGVGLGVWTTSLLVILERLDPLVILVPPAALESWVPSVPLETTEPPVATAPTAPLVPAVSVVRTLPLDPRVSVASRATRVFMVQTDAMRWTERMAPQVLLVPWVSLVMLASRAFLAAMATTASRV